MPLFPSTTLYPSATLFPGVTPDDGIPLGVGAGGGLNVTWWAVHPTTGVRVPLPDVGAWSLSPIANASGALSLSYPVVGRNFATLNQYVTEKRDLEVEVWFQGDQASALRGILYERSSDLVDEAMVVSFGGHFLEHLMSEMVVLPYAPHPKKESVFSAVSPGTLMATLMQRAQADGYLTGVTYSTFTGTTDSNGAAWDTTVTATYSPVQTSYTQVLDELVEQGACEWDITATRQLRLFKVGTRGLDRTVGATPTVLRRGRNLTEVPTKVSSREAGTDLWAAGGDNLYHREFDATARALRGRQVARAYSATGINNLGALDAAATARLPAITTGRREVTHGVLFGAGDPLPLAGFHVGDYVYSNSGETSASAGGGNERLRIAQWSLSRAASGEYTGTISLNDLFDEQLVRIARQLARLQSGSTVVGTSPPATLIDDGLTPAAPTGLVASSIAYQDDAHSQTLAAVTLSWSAVTTNSDGTAAFDIAGYKVFFAYLGLNQVGGVPSSNPPDQVIAYTEVTPSSGIPGTSFTIGGVEGGASIGLQVLAFDNFGNQSARSAALGHTASNDNDAPPTPSTPTARNFLRQLIVEWDGLGSAGEVMPRDFSYVEVHRSAATNFTPTPATQFERLYAKGGAVYDPGSYGGASFFKLIAVDAAGNKSGPSGQATATPSRAIADDVGDAVITGAKLANATIPSSKVTFTSRDIGSLANFYQPTQPTTGVAGDLWVDTDDGNKLYRLVGSTWMLAQDSATALAEAQAAQSAAADALSAANNAQAAADGKVTVFYQAAPPTGAALGDLWIDTDDTNKLYRWSGTAWVLSADTRTATALANAATAQSTADGKIDAFYQAAAPTGASVGDLWYDTDDGNAVHRWNGTSWTALPVGSGALGDAAVIARTVAANQILTEHLTVANFSDNMLPNGGFEDAALTGTAPAGWSVNSSTGGTHTFTRETVTANIQSGGASAKLTMSAASGLLTVKSEAIPTKPGDNWYFEVSAKASRALNGLTLLLGVGDTDLTNTTSPILASAQPLTTAYPAEPLGVNYTVPATVGAGVAPKYLRFFVRAGNVVGDPAAVTVWVDGVRARKVVGTAEIQDAAISRAKIGLAEIGDAQIETMSVGKLTAGTMTATVTNSGLFRTASTGNRVEFDGAGIRLFMGTTVVGRWQTSDATMLMTGTYQSGLSGERINILPDGSMLFYPTSGTNSGKLSNFGNDLVMRGLVDVNGRSGRVNANVIGVGINFSAESEIPSDLRSEVIVFDRGVRTTAPIIEFRLDGKLAPTNGNRRIEFYQSNSAGTSIGASFMYYASRAIDNLPGLTGNNSGITFSSSGVIVTTGASDTFGPISATAYNPPSSETVKENVADAGTKLDALSTIRAARSKSYNYTWEKWRTPAPTPEDPNPARVAVTPPTRFGPLAEHLPAVLQVEIPHPFMPGETTLGVSLGDQIGVLWAAVAQLADAHDVLAARTPPNRGAA